MRKFSYIFAYIILGIVVIVIIYIVLLVAFFFMSPLLIWINKDFFSAFPFPVMTLENLKFLFEVIITPISSLIVAFVAIRTLKIVIKQTETMNRNHEATHAPLIILGFKIDKNNHLMMYYSNINDKMSSISSDFFISYKITRSNPSGDPIDELHEKHYALMAWNHTETVDISDSLIKTNNSPVEIEILKVECLPCYTDSFSVAGTKKIKYYNGNIEILDLWPQKNKAKKR